MAVDLKERLERIAPAQVAEPDVEKAWRKGRRMRTTRLAVQAAGLAAFVVVAALIWPSAENKSRTLQPAEEKPVSYEDTLEIGARYEAQPVMGLDGWYSEHTSLRLKGDEDGPVAWISNAPFQDEGIDKNSYPLRSLTELPEDGALILVSLHTRADFESRKHWFELPERSLPLNLEDATGPDDSYEGQPATRPDLMAYGLDSRVGRYSLRAEAYFSSVPTEQELKEANEALATLEIIPAKAEVSYTGAPLPDASVRHIFNGNVTTEEQSDSIELPSDWRFHDRTEFPSTFAFSNFPTSVDGGFCDPGAPLDTLPADGAFVWAYEISRGDEIPRPEHFILDPLTLAPYEGSGCRTTYLLSFKDGERSMATWIALGEDVSARTIALTLRALDSLKLQR